MKRRILRILCIALVIAIVLSLAISAGAADEQSFTILHTNDMHGYPQAVPYVKGLADELRADGKEVLIVDAGDALGSTAFSSYADATNMVTVMNMAGYNVYTIGNHEGFMTSIDVFKKAAELAEFPFIGANVDDEYREAGEMSDYVILEAAGAKIAFIGLTNGFHTTKNGDDAVACAEAAREAAEAEGATMFIGVFHLGITDTALASRSTYIAEKCDWLDIIIDAHCHTAYSDTVNGVFMVETGEYSNNIGVLNVTVKDGVMTDVSYDPIAIRGNEENCGITPDADIVAYIDEVNESLAYLQETVATFPVALDGERTTVRAVEALIGNIATDAMIHYSGADIAFVPGPFIRKSVEEGDLTREQMQAIFMSASTPAYFLDMTGEELVTFLELCLDGVPEVSNSFRQIGGIRITFDETKEVGSRLASITMADGSDFDLEKTYRVICTTMDLSYILGEDYAEQDIELEMFETSINQMFVDYVNDELVASWEIDGRIASVNVPEPQPEPEPEPRPEPEPDPEPQPEPPAASADYVVVKGDNLWKIAKKTYGDGNRWVDIYNANKDIIKNPDMIYIGQELKLP